MPVLSSSALELRIGLNVTVNGSKNMTSAQQEALPVPAEVRVVIVDAANPANVLYDGVA